MAVEPFLATRAQRAFVLTITIQAIVVLVMVGITFKLVEDKVNLTITRYKTLPCYLALFALGEIFELLMAFDALRSRNVIQLIGILIFHVALLVYAALQIHETRTAIITKGNCDGSVSFVNCGGPHTLWAQIHPFLIVAPSIIGAAWLVMFFYFKKLYSEFGWAIFHVVGANPRMKNMYRWYQIMICLLKFDFFFFGAVTMQLLIVVLSRDSAEFGVTVAAIPVVLILLVLCGVAVQREIKWIMTISLAMMLAASSYLFKLVRFYQPSTRDQYLTTRATLTTFTLCAFLLLVGTFAVGIRCFADFEQGLESSKMNAVPSRPRYSKQGKAGFSETSSGVALGPRLSIE